MLDEKVTEPTQPDWAASIFFALKKGRSPHFCDDYRTLNAVSVEDLYRVPCMAECIDFLEDATVF